MTETPAPDLRALRGAVEAATPGPWRLAWYLGGERDPATFVMASSGLVASLLTEEVWTSVNLEGDAAFIAAANPTAVLALIERVEAAEAESARLRSIIESARNTCSRSPLCVPYARADA